jgi:hypothetical protein
MLEDAKRRLAWYYQRAKNIPEWWNDKGFCDIIKRAELDVEKLEQLVELERRRA